jgi:hypothetical protein
MYISRTFDGQIVPALRPIAERKRNAAEVEVVAHARLMRRKLR